MEKIDIKPKLICPEAGKTKQKTGMEHDINKLVARYQKTGVLEIKEDMNGQFIDCCNVGDFHQAMNKIAIAKERFDMLPSSTRARFHNDPGELLDYLATLKPETVDEAVRLGLVTKTEVKALEDKKAEPSKKGGENNEIKPNN